MVQTVNNAVASPTFRPCPPPRRRRRGHERTKGALSLAARRRRQLLFRITRQLVEAQFVRGDQARAQRLWNEAAALALDPERIIHLLYGVADHADSAEMEAVDRLMGRGAGAWPRNAPAAASPGHR